MSDMDALLDFVERARAAQAAVNIVLDASMTLDQRERKLDDLEATIGALEITAVIQAKVLFLGERGHEPRYDELVHWANLSHRPLIAGFLEMSRSNPAITSLFTKETHHGGDHGLDPDFS